MKILCPSPVVGLQKKEEGKVYRLMHYVVKQDVAEGVLLYNTLTCALALVTHEEAQHLTDVEGLIEHYFLVPVDHDDKKFCKLLRIGNKVMQKRPKGIRKYTIVTTTGCNARCAYCFEQGVKPVSMTMEMAEKVAQYIITHRGEHEEVQIDWFGGEPLYNFKVMDRISTRLKEHNIKFFSRITTNGYLFSDRLVEKACELWNTKMVQITLDGTEENYNRIKAYVHTNGANPYQRVMGNIKRLLETKIGRISIRINLSYNNLADIWDLTKACGEQFREYKNLGIYFAPLYEYRNNVAEQLSIQRKVIYEEKAKLQNFVDEMGLKGLRHSIKQGIVLGKCMVDSEDAVMILPEGQLGLCEHYLDSRFIGHIDSDDWDQEEIKRSREYCKETLECDTCACYPKCYRLKICSANPEVCFKEWREDQIASIRYKMLRDYQELNK